MPIPLLRRNSIDGVRVVDGSLYAQDAYRDVARYQPAQDRWVSVPKDSIPIKVEDAFEESDETLSCVSGTPARCYRLKPAQVELSADGGQTWRTDWQFHPSPLFVSRLTSGRPNKESMGPYALEILNLGDKSHIVAVALGAEGVLLRDPSGTWQRQPALRVEPTHAIEQLLYACFPEIAIWWLGAMTILLWLFCASWRQHARAFVLWPAVLAGLATILSLILSTPFASLLSPMLGLPSLSLHTLALAEGLSIAGAWISQSLLALGLFLIWRKHSGSLAQPEYAHRAATDWYLTVAGILWLGIAPFLLWTFRIIAAYSIVLLLALGITGLLLWWGLRRVVPLMRAAWGDTAQSEEHSY